MDLETTPIDQLDSDAMGFVVNSWVRSWHKQQPGNVDAEVFYRTFPDVARMIARRGDVLVAHFEGAPDLFIGWVAFDRANPSRVHYVYVKQSFRRQGAATRLLKDNLTGGVEMSLSPTHRWKRDWLGRLGYKYNPYQLMLIGDQDDAEAAE